jgi:choline dehydrogenase-like flavoprotein
MLEAATPMPTKYEAIIVGSGQAGNPLANALSSKGKRTARIEPASTMGAHRPRPWWRAPRLQTGHGGRGGREERAGLKIAYDGSSARWSLVVPVVS